MKTKAEHEENMPGLETHEMHFHVGQYVFFISLKCSFKEMKTNNNL